MDESAAPARDPDEYVDPEALADHLCESLVPAETSLQEVARDVAALARRGSQGMFGDPDLDAAFDRFTAVMARRTVELAAEVSQLVDVVREKVLEYSDVVSGAEAELARVAQPPAPEEPAPEEPAAGA